MSIVSVEKDFDDLSLTLIAEFDAPVAAVWELWADPRKLERWWGPPSHPATVRRHVDAPGCVVQYLVVERNEAAVGPQQPCNHVDQRGLAGARCAEQAGDAALAFERSFK